jgi:hypothetical protein
MCGSWDTSRSGSTRSTAAPPPQGQSGPHIADIGSRLVSVLSLSGSCRCPGDVSVRDLPSHSLPSTVRYLGGGGSPSLWPKEEPSIRFSSRHIRSSRQTQTRISSSWADMSGGVLLVARFPIKLVSHWTTSIWELAAPARHARPRIHLSKCSDTRLHDKRLRGVFDPGSLSCWTLPATPTTVALWKLGVSLREAGSELPRMRQIESHRFEDTHRRATGCNYALPPASGRPCCLSRSRAIRSPVG